MGAASAHAKAAAGFATLLAAIHFGVVSGPASDASSAAAVATGVVSYPAEGGHLPVFDVGKLESALSGRSGGAGNDGGKALRDSAAAALRSALLDKGIFYLTNVAEGADVDDLAGAVGAVTKRVMDLPPEATADLTTTGLPPRGLAPLETESVAATLGVGTHTDLCAKWTMGSNPEFPNVWPEGDGEFRRAWETYHDMVTGVSKRFLRLAARALDVDGLPQWRSMLGDDGGETNLRHIRYPDVREDRCSDKGLAPPERMAAHHDLDLVTLIHQTPAANGFVSLQGQFPGSDRWVGVPTLPNTLVVTCGEVMSILSGGKVTATTHRVTVPTTAQRVGSARATTAIFYQPRGDIRIKPLGDTDFGAGGYDFGESGIAFSDWIQLAFAKLKATHASAQ